MATVESAIKLMSKCCYMYSIDLRNAYYSIPIAPEFRRCLDFIWREEMLQFTALPMGLSRFTRVTITEVKVDKVLALCRSFIANRSFTIRHVASLIGTLVSTFLGTFSTHGLWSEAEITYHINVLELLTLELGLRPLLVDCQGQHIQVVSDNTTAVSCINGMRGKYLHCDSITRNIWSWAIDQGNWLSAAHIPGTSNGCADNLSRNFQADTE